MLLSVIYYCSVINISAQDSFSFINTPLKFKVGANNLDTNATVGGLNSPQFGTMDLNQDGKKDLVIFDKAQNKFFTFLNNGQSTNSYKYEPYFETFFPNIEKVMLLRDYDRDGKKDLIGSSGNQDMVIYKNITTSSDKGPQFRKLSAHYYLNNYAFGETYNPLTARKSDYPIVGDMDNDGDLDILKYEAGYGTIGYYLNKEVEKSYTNGDSFLLEYSDICWGSFQEKSTANQILFGACGSQKKYRHLGGSALLEYDFDNDGDVDLIMTNSGYNDAIYIENGKVDFTYPYDTAISSTNSFPPSSPINVTSFPHLFLEDLNNDGKKDLISAPGGDIDFKDLGQINFYNNSGTNDIPSFDIPNNNFLTNGIIDHGTGSSPVLWDEDNDGDLDLFIAASGDYTTTSHTSCHIYFYKNNNGVFELNSTDYANISTQNFLDLTISFGDVNNDSKDDLIYGLRDGSVGWIQNSGTIGNPIFQSPIELIATSIKHSSAKPTMYDINNDAKQDLIVGFFNGNIAYYKNKGDNTFEMVTDTFGQVYTNYLDYSFNPPDYSYEGYAAPVIIDINDDEHPELITGTVDGKIKIYSINKSNPNAKFQELSSPLNTAYLGDTLDYIMCGRNSIPTIGDINNDKTLDIIIGTHSGGIKSFLGAESNNIKTKSINSISKRNIKLYPNPAKDYIDIYGLNNNSTINVQIYNLLGEIVLEVLNANSNLDISKIPNGTYIIKVAEGKNTSNQLIKKLIIIK
jgi:hypothetical protein